MIKRIAIIGSSDQQNPLIEKAKSLGFETHVFAWQTGYDIGEKSADYYYPISTTEKDEILNRVANIDVDAIVSIGSDIGALTAAYVAGKLGKVSNTYNLLLRSTNKILFRDNLKAMGIKQPQYLVVGEQMPDEIDCLKYPIVVKPSDRSGSRGVQLICNPEQLYKAVNVARELSFERKAILEEYVEGACYSCECISYKRHHTVVAFTKRESRNINGVLIDSTYKVPAVLPESIKPKIKQCVDKLLDNAGIENGASSIEFIIKEGDFYIIEITPSMYADYVGTHLVPESTGYDYLKAVIDVACGIEPETPIDQRLCSASVTFLYTNEDKKNTSYTIIPEGTPGIRTGHYFEKRKTISYGGCHKWLFEKRQSFYFGNNVAELNSEYTAAWYALICTGAQKVYLPYYISPSMIRAVKETNLEIVYYHIDDSFIPIDLCPGQNDAVIINNHCGLCKEYIIDFVKNHANVIIDNSTCFFEEPILKKDIYNVYSPRKFFPVPDGGYLITANSIKVELVQDISYKRARMLLRSFEMGEREAYKEQMANEQELVKLRASMSVLTKSILSSFDYERLKKKQEDNYIILDRLLRKYNKLTILRDDVIPQFYPLMVTQDIRKSLLQYNIFTPLMWRHLLCDEFTGMSEKRIAETTVYLPLDIQYSTDDMEYIAEVVLASLS